MKNKIKKCQTPNSLYTFMIKKHSFCACISLPFDVELDEKAAIKLENEMHDAMENIFKQFYTNNKQCL